MTRDIKEWFAWLESILALNVSPIRHRLEGLPKNIYDIPLVNVYEANGIQGDDWESYVYQQGQAWLFTTLHHTMSGLRIIRKASGGGTWDEKEKIYEGASCCVRKYKFKVESKNKQQATNERMRLRKFTMIEYTPKEDTPKYALCRISEVNKKNATSLQGEGKEIDHTDSNNGDKHKNSLSHESMQEDNKNNAHDWPLSSSQQRKGKEIDHGNKGHKGGNFQNTTADYNQKYLERNLRELRKHHSYADICKALDQVESKILSAASPKEESTEAPVSKTTHGRCTYTNIMEAGTSTKWQEQAKVEMFESNTYQEEPTNLSCDTNRNCLERNDEQGRNTIYREQLLSSCNTDDCFKLDDLPLDSRLRNQQLFAEVNAVVQEPNQLSHNFNANCTAAMDYQNRIESYPSTRNFATTEGRLDHQIVHPNAYVQQHNIFHHSYNNGNPTAPMLNNNHLLSSYSNISADGLSTGNYTTSVSRLDQQEHSELYHNFNGNPTAPMLNGNSCYPNISAPGVGTSNYVIFVDGSDQQLFESDANVLDPTENGNHFPIYNQNTIAPGLDTNSNATTEPEDMEWINNMDLSDTIDWNRV